MAPKAQGAPPEPPPPESAAGSGAENGPDTEPTDYGIVPVTAQLRPSAGPTSAAPKKKSKLCDCGRKGCTEKVPEEATCILYTTGLITTKGTGPGPGSWTRRSIPISLSTSLAREMLQKVCAHVTSCQKYIRTPKRFKRRILIHVAVDSYTRKVCLLESWTVDRKALLLGPWTVDRYIVTALTYGSCPSLYWGMGSRGGLGRDLGGS